MTAVTEIAFLPPEVAEQLSLSKSRVKTLTGLADNQTRFWEEGHHKLATTPVAPLKRTYSDLFNSKDGIFGGVLVREQSRITGVVAEAIIEGVETAAMEANRSGSPKQFDLLALADSVPATFQLREICQKFLKGTVFKIGGGPQHIRLDDFIRDGRDRGVGWALAALGTDYPTKFLATNLVEKVRQRYQYEVSDQGDSIAFLIPTDVPAVVVAAQYGLTSRTVIERQRLSMIVGPTRL